MARLKRAGNRGAVLMILGVLWILTAIGISGQPIPPRPPGSRLLPYEHLPVWFRVALWAAPGVIAVASGLTRRWDVTAWMLLIVPAAERSLSYAWAVVVDLFDPGSYSTAWRGFLVYAATGTLIYFCAAGLDQPPIKRGVRE